jgi:ribonuclease HII
MGEAVAHLRITPLCALVDGNVPPPLTCRCITVVKGDATEPSVSAASIVAKVTRDRYMYKMDSLYPGYGFSKHKGYPTRDHLEAIGRLGPSLIHRRTFKGVS